MDKAKRYLLQEKNISHTLKGGEKGGPPKLKVTNKRPSILQS